MAEQVSLDFGDKGFGYLAICGFAHLSLLRIPQEKDQGPVCLLDLRQFSDFVLRNVADPRAGATYKL